MTSNDDDAGLTGSPPALQLFGHEAERQFLQQQLAGGHLPHALLFEGEQGIGKASLAFHLAYQILAGQGHKAPPAPALWREPAADCPIWRKMLQDAHPGLLYIRRGRDPKSRNLRTAITVDDIRRVSRFLQQTAADNGWRIVLVDSADDMNRNAANALLKTLEEPPAKALFILIAHQAGRLLPTIRSRCRRMRFKPLPDKLMRAALPAVTAGSGRDNAAAPDDRLIALAAGSMGRALLLLSADGVTIINAAADVLDKAVFPAPQAQNLADRLSRRDNAEACAVLFRYLLDYIYKKSFLAAQAGHLARAAALAEFSRRQEQAIQEMLAFNLDKKQFILVLLQQIHCFLRSPAAPGHKYDDKTA